MRSTNFRYGEKLSQISPGISFGDSRRTVPLGGARRPCLLGQAAVSLHTRERGPGALRRVVAALQLLIVIAAGLLLVLLVLIDAQQHVAVAGVRAVLGRGVRGGRVTAFAQAAVRPRVVGPTLLSDRGADRG